VRSRKPCRRTKFRTKRAETVFRYSWNAFAPVRVFMRPTETTTDAGNFTGTGAKTKAYSN